MRIVPNTGSDRIVDLARTAMGAGTTVDLMSPVFSLFAFGELLDELRTADAARVVLPADDQLLEILGGPADRAARNRLQSRWLAHEAAAWLESKAELRRPDAGVPQAALVVRDQANTPEVAALGSFAFSTDGFGITPGNPMSMIQASESPEEAKRLAEWFDNTWVAISVNSNDQGGLAKLLRGLAMHRAPAEVYARILQQVLGGENALGEDQVVNAATGIRDTVVWQKLYRFQRDGVVGAIDKINRFGGCIIADSVGLGKTFEALAVIKYHELRNDRVLVLCPKPRSTVW